MIDKEIRIGQTTNADVYLKDKRHVGRIEEFEIDKIAYETVTAAALGMGVKGKLPSRSLEPIEAKIKFAWLETDVMLLTALPNRAIDFTFEKFVDIFDTEGLVAESGYRILTMVSLLFTEETLAAFKNGDDPVTREHQCQVMRLVIKSTETDQFIREIDVGQQINRVDSKDVWPRY